MATRIDEGNLPLAIGLSIGSGLATSVGGLTVFIEVFNRSSQATILSSALAVSAGVMLYVSFLEIFVKANDALEAQLEEGTALAVTTLCFFGGMGLTALLEVLVHYLNHVTGSPHSHGLPDEPAARSSTQLSEVQLEAGGGTRAGGDGAAAGHGQSHGNAHLSDLEPTDKKELMRTSTLTALAIALHNFPEGLATFIATLAEPSLGVALAVAIAVHNVPEGMAVAMPVYYSSGSKMKGFLWASLSGLTEPIGGILGAGRARLAAPPAPLRALPAARGEGGRCAGGAGHAASGVHVWRSPPVAHPAPRSPCPLAPRGPRRLAGPALDPDRPRLWHRLRGRGRDDGLHRDPRDDARGRAVPAEVRARRWRARLAPRRRAGRRALRGAPRSPPAARRVGARRAVATTRQG